MTPETLMAFFLVLAIAGIAGLAVYVYLLQGKWAAASMPSTTSSIRWMSA